MNRRRLPEFRSRLAADAHGVTVIEFALTAPVLLILIMSVFDAGHNIYMQSTARIAPAGGAQLDARRGRRQIGRDRRHRERGGSRSRARCSTDVLAPRLCLAPQRLAIRGLHRQQRRLVCSEGEPFEDANGNGLWDPDRGIVGQGGARDAVLYTVEVRYPRAFPVSGLIGLDPEFVSRAATVLRNQPFGSQETGAATGNCE